MEHTLFLMSVQRPRERKSSECKRREKQNLWEAIYSRRFSPAPAFYGSATTKKKNLTTEGESGKRSDAPKSSKWVEGKKGEHRQGHEWKQKEEEKMGEHPKLNS